MQIDIGDMDDVSINENVELTETETMVIATPIVPPVKREKKRNQRALETSIDYANEPHTVPDTNEEIVQAHVTETPALEEVVAEVAPQVAEVTPTNAPITHVQPRTQRPAREPRTQAPDSVQQAMSDLLEAPQEEAQNEIGVQVFNTQNYVTAPQEQPRQPRQPRSTVRNRESIVTQPLVDHIKAINAMSRDEVEARLETIERLFELRKVSTGAQRDAITLALTATIFGEQ